MKSYLMIFTNEETSLKVLEYGIIRSVVFGEGEFPTETANKMRSVALYKEVTVDQENPALVLDEMESVISASNKPINFVVDVNKGGLEVIRSLKSSGDHLLPMASVYNGQLFHIDLAAQAGADLIYISPSKGESPTKESFNSYSQTLQKARKIIEDREFHPQIVSLANDQSNMQLEYSDHIMMTDVNWLETLESSL